MASLVLLFSVFLHPEDARLATSLWSSSLKAASGANDVGFASAAASLEERRTPREGQERGGDVEVSQMDELGEARFFFESIWP